MAVWIAHGPSASASSQVGKCEVRLRKARVELGREVAWERMVAMRESRIGRGVWAEEWG